MAAVWYLSVLLVLTVINLSGGHVSSVTTSTKAAAHLLGSTVTTKHGIVSSTVKTTKISPRQTTARHVTVDITETLLSPQTLDRTEDAHPSRHPETTSTNQTSNWTVSPSPTRPLASGPPNPTAVTTVNTTRPDFSHDPETGQLVQNPGLVAVLCIFCIVLVLILGVAIVKCVRSSRSSFERLEDVPMGKVNEFSPFAQFSK